jgi:serine protease inhibitor
MQIKRQTKYSQNNRRKTGFCCFCVVRHTSHSRSNDLIFSCFLAGLICASLAAEPGVNDESDPTHGGIFNKNYEQQKQPNKLPGEYIHIDEKNDQFDWELTKQILKTNPNKNTIVSPLSVKTLMTLIAEAAGQSVDSLTRRVRN